MNLTRWIIVLALMLGASSRPGRAEQGPTRSEPRTFQLVRKPLECDMRRFGGLPMRRTPRFRTRQGGLEGFEAAQVAETTMPPDLAEGRKIAVVLAKKASDDTVYDWLLVDANGDSRFDDAEQFHLRQGQKSVQIQHRQDDYLLAMVMPVAIGPVKGAKGSPRWLALHIYQHRGRPHIRVADVTLLTGKVAFGDVEVPIGITRADPKLKSEFRSVPEITDANRGKLDFYVASQILFDANSNGRFEPTYFYDMGAENRWLTRLVRLGETWYELDIARDGASVRIQVVQPKLGKLTVPEGVAEVSIVGPEFATKWVDESQRDLILPVGGYYVYAYRYQHGGVSLYTRDTAAKAPFEIKAEETTRLDVGGPLGLTVDASQGRGRSSTLHLQLNVLDQAGREVASLSSGKRHQRPPAPRFKIVNAAGKTIHSGKFEYG